MKRFISLVCGSLVLILMFLAPGNAVQAEEQDDCECPGTVFTGAERNKLVANLLKSSVFKEERLELKKEGYVWQGAGAIEIRELAPGTVVYQVVFLTENGVEVGAAFGLLSGSIINLEYLAPIHDHNH
jgi:hypothetical protein